DLLPPYLDGNLELNDLLGGVPFASACSGYDPPTSKITVHFLLRDHIVYVEQLELFQQHKDKVKALLGEETMTSIISNAIYFTKLNQMGAKRIGVISTPPVGCRPSQRTSTNECDLIDD
ncbi:hypothetical protein EJB05_44252, partial [Eragrostis curvula]